MVRLSFARVALVGATVAAALACPATSTANGRIPASVNVRFQPGDAETIYLPVTFGLVTSTDDGQSFRWLCEAGIGYGGMFDPHYVVTADGAIYASTFEGLRVSRDGGCTFETVQGLDRNKFLSAIELGPDGRLWIPTSNAQGGNDVWVSTDGETFVSAGLAEERAWWLSVSAAPSDPQRIYVTGYLPRTKEAEAQPLLRRSIDGGATWEELPTTDFEFAGRRDLYLLGTSPTDPDIVFAKVLDAIPPAGDVLYRSPDGGLNWEKVAARFSNELLAFLIRPDGQTVITGTVTACPEDPAGAENGCVWISNEAGAPNTWRRTKEQPRLACIGERSDGVLFACGDNWDPDNFALARSTDGETWEKVYRFSETIGPADCPANTAQAECAVEAWPDLCFLLGICIRPDAGASAQDAGEPDDGAGDDSGGCCRVGGSTDAGWIPGLLLVLAGLAWRSRRVRKR